MSFGCEYNSKEQEGTMSTILMDGALYANMIKSGAAELSDNIKLVNDLNVFPIPDGDTGDNMFMTIDSGAAHLTDESETSIFKIADRAAGGMLLGARGNSGVILSRIFAGIAKGLKDKDSVNVPMFSKAMESGVKEAYGAVSVPVEGTILTVYKDGVRYANSRVTNGSSFDDYFNDLIWELKRSLDRTPDLLAVLKEAGVVDSGGAGFIYIAEGMKKAIGGEILSEGAQPLSARKNIDLNAFTEDSVLEFGYCTEFLLRLQKAKIDIDSFDIDALISWLNSVGDSVVAFREGTIVKVHVHTKKPGDVFNYVQQFGEFLTMKIENMTLQHNETHAQKQFEPKPKKPHKKYGIVSVATGDGIKDTFLSLGCDCVVDGGQSMNPSTEDLIEAFEEVNADIIFVFPNNGNIIMAANQAAALYKDADVHIIPSKTIGEGYAAISMLDTTSNDIDTIIAEQKEIIAGVVTGMVSKAVRDTEMDGVEIKKDDYVGFVEDKIYIDDQNRKAVAFGLTEKLGAKRYDIMLVIVGEDVPKEESDEIYKELRKAYRRTEIVMIDGGQPIYDYIIILE